MMYFHKAHWLKNAIELPASWSSRVVFFAAVLMTNVFGVVTMLRVLQANGISWLEGSILGLFAVTFGWISIAFWTAVAGFVLQLIGRDPLSFRRRVDRGDPDAPIIARTAVVMPVYNENTRRVIAGLEATYLDLMATGEGGHYDFYLLSDTTDPVIADAEEDAVGALCRRLNGAGRLFYRRRTDNEGRKAGNIAEFCRRWGSYYDYMVVLDADSVMTGEALLELTRAMQSNPSAGIIQTVPIPVRQHTMFGRFMQFAAGLYGPMLATGLAFWQRDSANYWGHNAIVRVRAFMAHCGLPTLPGSPPLGGEILSHDFVEAALMRRSGYHVYLYPELEGSFEETPGNLLDHAKRDRRWTEGNLQHIRLVTAHGLHPLNRLHFVMGALAYLCSFLWLTMLGAGTADAVGRAVDVHEFFGSGPQLYPDWPVTRTGEIASLLGTVVVMLFSPKIMAVVLGLLRRERRLAFGGGLRLAASAVGETVFAVLIAPVMMAYHAYFVTGVMLGRRAVWAPQSRDGNYVSIGEGLSRTAILSLAGIIWGVGTAMLTPIFFLALTPVLVGLVFAGPLITVSSSPRLGAWLWHKGLFLAPCETRPAAVLGVLSRLLQAPARKQSGPLPRLLPERYADMPAQTIDRGPRWDRRLSPT